MKEAIELARNGYGKTRTNPLVGAILYKDGKKIGEGWHNKFGVEHAEVNAIRSVRNVRDLKGARMIVTLEPCSHFGKTPPCVDAIVQAGIAEVFVGMKDPFSRVAGRGIKALRDAGIKVELLSRKDALYPDLLALNQPFLKVAKYGLPYVCMKAGMSLDGKIASSAGMSKWITSNESRVHAKKLREKFDAVVVGVNTVNVDDPSLLAKGALRVVLDGTLQISKKSKILKNGPVLIACGEIALNSEKADWFKKKGVELVSFGKNIVNLKKLLSYLTAEHNVGSVYVEGGSGVHGAFYDAFLKDSLMIDEINFYIAPFLLGGEKALSVVGGRGLGNLAFKKEFLYSSVELFKKDYLFRGTLNFYRP